MLFLWHMQTTLRIEDELYREAKVKAAQEGITLTRFIEEGFDCVSWGMSFAIAP
jgi:predicted HicB family RNase H-like nuclease